MNKPAMLMLRTILLVVGIYCIAVGVHTDPVGDFWAFWDGQWNWPLAVGSALVTVAVTIKTESTP